MTISPTTSSSPDSPSGIFEVLLFGALKDAVRVASIEVHAPRECTVSQLLQLIGEQFSPLEKYLPHVRVAVNCEYSALDQTIQSGDEIALIPPVAGG